MTSVQHVQCIFNNQFHIYNRECCVSDLLQLLQQTVRRRNQRPIEQTHEWPATP